MQQACIHLKKMTVTKVVVLVIVFFFFFFLTLFFLNFLLKKESWKKILWLSQKKLEAQHKNKKCFLSTKSAY